MGPAATAVYIIRMFPERKVERHKYRLLKFGTHARCYVCLQLVSAAFHVAIVFFDSCFSAATFRQVVAVHESSQPQPAWILVAAATPSLYGE